MHPLLDAGGRMACTVAVVTMASETFSLPFVMTSQGDMQQALMCA